VFLDGETRFYVSNKYILVHVANSTRLNLMASIIEFAVRKLKNNRRSAREIVERK
jgi:hypothetical protein